MLSEPFNMLTHPVFDHHCGSLVLQLSKCIPRVTGRFLFAPATGSSLSGQPAQPDYSAQWAEYYRNMGMVREAEAIEQQSKLKAASGGDPGGPPSAAGAGQPAANGTQADYSAQWVEYYRSQGLVTEAANLEQQIKLSKVGDCCTAADSGTVLYRIGRGGGGAWLLQLCSLQLCSYALM